MENQEALIVQKAIEYGYESCGIIKIDEISGLAEAMNERIEKAPGNEEMYGRLLSFAALAERYPWAKSIVVCLVSFCKYAIPEHLDGAIGKNYLVDVRSSEVCKEYNASVDFESYLKSLGMEVATDRRMGITSMRWVAEKAGLGVMRKNNFFYTEKSGSWIHIEAFLTDREMEYKQEPVGEPCPKGCDRCISACPTKSLSEPFTMSPATCVSPLTVRRSDLIHTPYGKMLGQWIYGCDVCQDACPHNANKWTTAEKFPGLAQLGKALTLEKIVLMDEEHLINLVADKFFYINRENIWYWKVNALNAMYNNYDEKYADTIKAALNDPNENVRKTAKFIMERI